MECTLCNVRSAIGTCNECHTMVCEECGVQCEHCGKWACPQHVYMTSSGKTLCLPCQEERRARHAAARRRAEGGYETPAPGGAVDTPVEQPAVEEEEPILTASVRQPPPPWKLSMYTAGVALALWAVVFVFPGLRRIPSFGDGHLATPYILMIVPLIAVFWGVVGYMREELQSERNRSMIGVGMAILASILLVVAVQTDPARAEEQRALEDQQERQNMTPAELEQWKKERLQRFQQ